MDYYYLRRENFFNVIKSKKITEIIRVDHVLNIKNGFSRIPYAGINSLSGITYTPSEYKDHLKNIVSILKQYENYNFIIEKTTSYVDYRLYVKEDLGAFIKRNQKPYVVFATKEANITAALWDYLNLSSKDNKSDKKVVIKNLQKLIGELEEVMTP